MAVARPASRNPAGIATSTAILKVPAPERFQVLPSVVMGWLIVANNVMMGSLFEMVMDAVSLARLKVDGAVGSLGITAKLCQSVGSCGYDLYLSLILILFVLI